MVTDEQVTAALAAFNKAINEPVMLKCERCDGRGYHHGFGETGHDPDWCADCGGNQYNIAPGEEERAMHLAIEAALPASPAPVAAGDWVMVPREATNAMMDAFGRARVDTSSFFASYRAMIAAAPTPPALAQPAADGDRRSLAIEIVDAVLGYSIEHSSDPDRQRAMYGVIEQTLLAAPAHVAAVEEFPQPSRKDGGEPCGECHIQPGETCDICGATAHVAADDYFGELVSRARAAAEKATRKFPQPNYVTLKIAEEAGEVVRGAVHYAEGRMPWDEVEGEIVQLLAMLIRFVTEGDEINGVNPPTSIRSALARETEGGRHE